MRKSCREDTKDTKKHEEMPGKNTQGFSLRPFAFFAHLR
jgi:hypothetical protein